MTKKDDAYKVEPIRDKAVIASLKQVLKQQGNDRLTSNRTGMRNSMLFEFGINTGLRVGDIVKLRVADITSSQPPYSVMDKFYLKEQKTGKSKAVGLYSIKDKLTEYIEDMRLTSTDYLFPSRKRGYHVSTTQVYRFLVEAGNTLGLDTIGTHTMRKTFGYWFIRNNIGSIEDLMVYFNHSSQAITKRYIGIQEDDIQNRLKQFKL